MDRKYSHRGYRDAERSEKKDRPQQDRKPGNGNRPGPNGVRGDQFGPRTPRMVGTVTRARCANCGAVLAGEVDTKGKCPKCEFELHCCKQCRFFDTGAQFECTKPIPARISPKDARNNCTFYEFRTTVEKDTAPISYAQKTPSAEAPATPVRSNDARQAFENLFKK